MEEQRLRSSSGIIHDRDTFDQKRPVAWTRRGRRSIYWDRNSRDLCPVWAGAAASRRRHHRAEPTQFPWHAAAVEPTGGGAGDCADDRVLAVGQRARLGQPVMFATRQPGVWADYLLVRRQRELEVRRWQAGDNQGFPIDCSTPTPALPPRGGGRLGQEPWQFLKRLPLPQGQMSLRPTPAKLKVCGRRKGGRAGWPALLAALVGATEPEAGALGGATTSLGVTGLAAAAALALAVLLVVLVALAFFLDIALKSTARGTSCTSC